MKKATLYLLLIAAVVLNLWNVSLSPVQAQQEDLDTFLARAAANSFLIALTRPELSGVAQFYLLDTVSDEAINQLLEPAITDFEITGADWISDVTYQVKANLQPGNREIAVYTGKYDGRWRVESIDLPGDVVAGTAAAETTESTTGPLPPTTAAGETAGAVVPITESRTGKLVFQTESGGDIYLINADGTGLRRVTHGIDPQLSPDGSRIAFTRWQPEYELFTINVDGSGEQSWTKGWRQMKSPTWSADGSKLIFSWQNGGRLEGERRRVNLADAARDDDPPRIPAEAVDLESVTLNGTPYLYYYLPADAYWYLKEVDLTTGQLTDLGTERHSYGPTGHPTAPNQVIYKGQQGLAIHDLQTNQSQPVTSDDKDRTPVISPDGSRIAVSYWQNGHWEIHTMNLDGSNRQRLTSTPLTVLAENNQPVSQEVMGKQRFVAAENPHWNSAAPVWSPDGQEIAFVTDRTGQWEIWIMNADGSNQRPMFPNGALDGVTLNYAGVDERILSWQ